MGISQSKCSQNEFCTIFPQKAKKDSSMVSFLPNFRIKESFSMRLKTKTAIIRILTKMGDTKIYFKQVCDIKFFIQMTR